MKILCMMLGVHPGEEHLGKCQNDPEGYFTVAKKNLLCDPSALMACMVNLDIDSIPEGFAKAINGILNGPDFSLENVRKANTALTGVCMWAIAMMKYHELLKIVNPVRDKAADMKAQLKSIRIDLAEKRAVLAATHRGEVHDRIQLTQQEFVKCAY